MYGMKTVETNPKSFVFIFYIMILFSNVSIFNKI
jgi:hypothetical protein